jgi:hypothetical protein
MMISAVVNTCEYIVEMESYTGLLLMIHGTITILETPRCWEMLSFLIDFRNISEEASMPFSVLRDSREIFPGITSVPHSQNQGLMASVQIQIIS